MKAIHFEVISYLLFGLTIILLLTRWKGHREYWYLFFAASLSFPFEWISDNFWMFLQYDWSFTMMFGRFPLMMPFAWSWFFGVPLVLMLRYEATINRIPLWGQILAIWVVFSLWDFVVEASSSNFGLWTYYWPQAYLVLGVPLLVPAFVGISFLMYYYGHKYLRGISRNKSWIKGLAIHVGGFYVMNTVRACVGRFVSVGLMGIEPVGMQIVWPFQ